MKKYYLRFANVFLAVALVTQTALPVFALADAAKTLPTLPVTEVTDVENTQTEPTLPMTELADAENTQIEPTLPMTELADAEKDETEKVTAEEANLNTIMENESTMAQTVPEDSYPITTQVIGGKATINVDKTNPKPGELVTVEITDIELENNKHINVWIHLTENKNIYVRMKDISESNLKYQFQMPSKSVNVKVEFQDIITIISQPASQTVTEGNTAVFRIETKSIGSSDRTSYQWQTLNEYNQWTDIYDATQKFYKTKNTALDDNGKQFRCIITCRNNYTSSYSSTIASDTVTLIVQDVQPTDRTIIAVADFQPIKVKYYEKENLLNLPKVVTVTLDDNSQEQLAVAWDTSNYDKHIPDDYILIGNLVLPNGVTNSKQLTAQIKVTVSEGGPEQSHRDDLIVSLEVAYSRFQLIPYRITDRSALIQAIIKAEKAMDMEQPTSRDYVTAVRELDEASDNYSPDIIAEVIDPENPGREGLNTWVKYAPDLAKINLFTQHSRDRLMDETEAAQRVLDNENATETEFSDAYKALLNAVKSLERVRASEYPGKNALKALLKVAQEKAADRKYTQESRDTLNKAIKTVQAVLDNPKAIDNEVFDAESALMSAIEYLEVKPNTDKPSTGGGSKRNRSSSSGGGSYVQPNPDTIWDINDSLTKSLYGVNVTVSPNYKLSTAFLNELMVNKQKSVTLKGGWYNWNFYGTSIESTMPGVMWFDTTISTVTSIQPQISKLTGKSDITVLHFAYQGKLPGKTKIDVDIDKYANKKVYIYYHNAAKSQLELVQSNVSVNANGIMEFTISYCADYVISPTVIKGAVTVAKPAPKK
ncbi:Ig-like domain-containing protein [Hydrogenoanaerobacterium sp.]|uniref:Ig-like domain-containing protein n=1 Tax=Hydrogenoanaerobacterium sp. TaxID=2953763 RepID=UPI00289C3D19|nr:Ig-like domain-containing protein [Hydrogenoanaerobacterium sp.]